jgi:hypothetical protein
MNETSFFSNLVAPPHPISAIPSLRELVAPPAPVAQGIKFGGTLFSEPTVFFSCDLPATPGLYVILVFDFSASPRPYRPLYFGKAEELNARVNESHEKFAEWKRAADTSLLFVAYYAMPGSSDSQRAFLESALIGEYRPECNVVGNPFTW